MTIETTTDTLMRAETLEAGATVARLLERNGAALHALGARLRAGAPDVVFTCAR